MHACACVSGRRRNISSSSSTSDLFLSLPVVLSRDGKASLCPSGFLSSPLSSSLSFSRISFLLPLSLSFSPTPLLSRGGNSVARRGGRKIPPLSLSSHSLPLFSLFLFLLSLSLSRDGEFPSRGELFSLFSLSRNGNNFRRARGAPSFPLFLSFLSSPSLSPSLSGDGNKFRRAREVLSSRAPLPREREK